MPDAGQRSLADFDSQRPAAEAEAVVETTGRERVVDPSRDSLPEPTGTAKLGIVQVDYTIVGAGEDERPLIHLFGRRTDGTAEHVCIHGFRPYFYAPADAVAEDELIQYDRITGWEETDAADEPFRSIRGDRLVKIYAQTPRDVGQLRDEFEHYEADILFPNRFLIDKDIQSGVVIPERRDDDGTLLAHHSEVTPTDYTAPPRVCMLDIEVDDRRGFPEDGDEPIVCLTTHDNHTDEYVAWLAVAPASDAAPPAAVPEYEPLSEDATITVRSFDSEPAMLDALVSYIEDTDPDVLSGWNFTDFDAPYLLDRLDVLNGRSDHDLDVERLSRVDEVWRSDWGGPSIKGRVVFDLLYAYQRTKFTELDSYRLDDVGEMELGVGKERYPGDIGDLWEDDPERLLEYNLRDVELCVELNRSQDIIPFWNEVRSFVGCKLEDATTPGDAVDMYVLHKLHGEFALPSKGQQESEDYEGGAVFDPITGVRENVSVLDLRSLYPMCMVTINASPETKADPEAFADEAAYKNQTHWAPNGTRFHKEPDGVIREMVEELLAEREEKKALRNDHDPDEPAYEQYDRQQEAVKVIMNCFTPDTEVLTPAGVRNIRDLNVGDDVYSLNPDSMEMEIKPVTETHEYPNYRGELVDIQTEKIDFRVTPNHRMLVRKNDVNGTTEKEWDFVEAGDLREYCHYEMPHDWEFDHEGGLPSEYNIAELIREHTDVTLTIADGGTKLAAQHGTPNVSKYIDTDDLLELLAWYITEGNVYEAKTGNWRVKIAQESQKEASRIESLVDELVEYYYTTDRQVSFSSRPVGELFENLCGSGSENKRIPEFVFSASQDQKRKFLSTLIAGDGDRQVNSWRYTTKSRQLRDDVLRLCTHLGLTASYNLDGDVWRIHCTENGENSFRMYHSGEESEAENGVYCVTVDDNNTLLAGRNGKFQNVSNSLYGVLGWDRFRLYDREMGAAVTATGREVIEFTEEVANELDKEVIYGDSVTGDRPVVVRNADGKVRILPIADLFERARSSGVSSLRRTDDGGVTADPSPKEYGALDGWDALSLSEHGDAEWQPIERVIRHETSKDVLRMQHPAGESTTTRDHSYVVEENGAYRTAPPESVDQPVRIPAVPPVEEKRTIDLYEVLHGAVQASEDGRDGTLGETVTGQVHADEEYVWFGHHGGVETTPKLKRHADVDSEDGQALIRLLAAYLSSGRSAAATPADHKPGVSIADERVGWLKSLRADSKRLFDDVTASVTEDSSSEHQPVDSTETGTPLLYEESTYKLTLQNELAAVVFRELTEGTTGEKQVPPFVFHLPARQQYLFLATLAAEDSSQAVPQSGADDEWHFDFETTSQELAAGVAILLIQREEPYDFQYRSEAGSYRIRTADQHRRDCDPVYKPVEYDGDVYDLSVAENENFVDGVGGIVLHNTDSVMLSVGTDVDTETAIEQSFELEEQINDSYDEFARERLNAEEHRFEIEFEKLYRRFFQAGKKKRYAGHVIWSEGKTVDSIDITGFEYQRSDIAPLTKEVQRDVIERIVYGDDVEAITEYLHAVIEDVLEGDIDPEEIAIPGGIGKRLGNYETATAHVRGAQYANLLLGTNFGRGSKPKRIYLEKVHPDFFERVEAERGIDPHEDQLYREFKRDPDVICFEYADQLPDEFEIDWETMLKKTLKGPIERILAALEISWDEVRTGQEQTGLGQFM